MLELNTPFSCTCFTLVRTSKQKRKTVLLEPVKQNKLSKFCHKISDFVSFSFLTFIENTARLFYLVFIKKNTY